MHSIEQFHKFEREESLFHLKINDVFIWQRIRFYIYQEIHQELGTGKAHTKIELSRKDQLNGLKLWSKNLIFRNPLLSRKSDFLFVGHPRRKKGSDGYFWDIYCDPIHENCSLNYVHFEMPHLLDHYTPAKTKRLRYLEFVHYSGTIQRKLGFHDVPLTDSEINKLRDIENRIQKIFGTTVELVQRVKRLLTNRKCRLWLYRLLLDKVDPKIAVVVVSYGKHLFIEACKQKGIPTVELQHGVIYPNHLGYSFSGNRTKELFPDYLLTWGEFWNTGVEFPIPKNRVISVGYPFLEKTKMQYEEIHSKDQIIFISQGTIGKQLSKFALKADQHSEINHEIVFKLHPGEYDRWQDEYPWLVDADFEIIDSSEPPLYELFAESSVQIGVYSTAIYEGLAFDLQTYIYDCSGANILKPLIDEGSAELISSADEVANSIGRKENSFESDYYFAPNATEKMCEVLNHLADEGTPYQA